MKTRSTLGIWRTIALALLCAVPGGLAQGQTVANGQGAARVPAADPVVGDLDLSTPVLPQDDVSASPMSAAHGDATGHVYACDACGGGGCDDCSVAFGASGTQLGVWLRADYLLWWEKDSTLPPLVTTSTGNPAAGDVGVIGVDTTRVLLGGQVNDNPLNGFRIEFGSWLDPAANVGLFARYFTSGDRNVGFSAGPEDLTYLAIPFFNLADNGEDAVLVTSPGDRSGSVNAALDGDAHGWEVLLRSCGHMGGNYRVDYVIGYRYFQLQESLTLSTQSTVLPGSQVGIQGQQSSTFDAFRTENDFHGLDLGITGHSHEGCWSLDFLAKVALGNMRELLNIEGSGVVETPGAPTETLVGGIFSQESNIGAYKNNQFAWIPELNVNIGYAITPKLDFTIGYSLIYVTDTIRSGTSVDRVIDPAFFGDLDPLVGNRPRPIVAERDFWLQGLNLGFTGRF